MGKLSFTPVKLFLAYEYSEYVTEHSSLFYTHIANIAVSLGVRVSVINSI